MTTESTQTLIPMLTKDNYDSWCIKLKAFLGSQECIDLVQYDYDEPESKEAEDALQEAHWLVLKRAYLSRFYIIILHLKYQ